MYEQQIDLFSNYNLNPAPSVAAKSKVVTKVTPMVEQPRSPVSTLKVLKHPAGTAAVRPLKRQPKQESAKESVPSMPKPKVTAPVVESVPKPEPVTAPKRMPSAVTSRRVCEYIAIAPGEAIVPEPPYAIFMDCEAAKAKKA